MYLILIYNWECKNMNISLCADTLSYNIRCKLSWTGLIFDQKHNSCFKEVASEREEYLNAK